MSRSAAGDNFAVHRLHTKEDNTTRLRGHYKRITRSGRSNSAARTAPDSCKCLALAFQCTLGPGHPPRSVVDGLPQDEIQLRGMMLHVAQVVQKHLSDRNIGPESA